MAETVRLGRRSIEVSRPDKLLFPDDGITKAELIDYYRTVAPRMVPQLRGRPLMLERYPDGIGAQRFMQKRAPAHFPDWITRAQVPMEGGRLTHVVCDDAATLGYLADQACITLHRWLSRADEPHHPDRLVIDLDPDGDDFEQVRSAAHRLAVLLDELEVTASWMTTGSRGLHAVVALDRGADDRTVLGFARAAAALLAARHPRELTTAGRKEARRGRLYLDVARNGYAQTAVAPYSVRPLPGAPIAAPISAEELDDPGLGPRRWTLREPCDLLDGVDPWRGAGRHVYHLDSLARRLSALAD